jgi:hypothetical protein
LLVLTNNEENPRASERQISEEKLRSHLCFPALVKRIIL